MRLETKSLGLEAQVEHPEKDKGLLKRQSERQLEQERQDTLRPLGKPLKRPARRIRVPSCTQTRTEGSKD